MPEASHAVFLSYASQDAEAAQRICEALRAARIEVWLDQGQLRGGDIWDQKIRQQIRDCALFLPIISENTQARSEGYFRLEWRLADQRTHLMGRTRTFLVPVCVDATREQDADVPDSFSASQWTRLPGGEASREFVARIQLLLSPDQATTTRASSGAVSGAAPAIRGPSRPSWWRKPALLTIAAVLVLAALSYVVVESLPISKHLAPSMAFAPPPHSVAVLPFLNMSGDREQEYFSDGLTEEVLNSLARINELQVSARTSSFSFKGKDADIGTIARKLNVASILEGSVRRSGHTIRVTAQLNNAVTGYHLWSQTYDRDLGDVLQLQTDIANAVADALKVTLLGDVVAKIEAGGTHTPAAFDAYLRAANFYRRFGPVNLAAGGLNEQGLRSAIAAYTEAVRADSNYALAYAGRSLAFADFARALGKQPDMGDYLDKAQMDARKAIAIAPELAEGHQAMANLLAGSLDFPGATSEYERAFALAPGNARVLKEYGAFVVLVGRTEAGLAAAHRALVLDPLNPGNHFELGVSLTLTRRYGEAVKALTDARALAPDDVAVNMWLGIAHYLDGDYKSAQAACERAGDVNGPWCLAMIYDKLGRRAEAEAMLTRLLAQAGDRIAEGYADIYAQWGDTARALDWLETAMRNRDPYLAYTKINPFFDPLRKEPRFQAVMRDLRFPD